eukprot:m.257392 g.257392  ORF g.257392 m.257392 type:complete len:143 (+) comp26753_c0_seq5:1451-1879(+)
MENLPEVPTAMKEIEEEIIGDDCEENKAVLNETPTPVFGQNVDRELGSPFIEQNGELYEAPCQIEQNGELYETTTSGPQDQELYDAVETADNQAPGPEIYQPATEDDADQEMYIPLEQYPKTRKSLKAKKRSRFKIYLTKSA